MNSTVALLKSSYSCETSKIGVVHIGLGAFHRAHQAVYFDRLMNTGETDWGIVGVNLRPGESPILENLDRRNCKYILKSIATDSTVEYREIRSVLALSDWCKKQQETENLLTNPHTQLVTITVTESGYYTDAKGNFDPENFVILEEIQALQKNSCPAQLTVYGYLRQALNQRKSAINLPITVLCCDNFLHNGKSLRKGFLAYLKLMNDSSLINWIERKVSFPCSMVDRITPKINPKTSEETEKLFGISGDNSVLSEDFIQWVIEDDFKGKRPALEKVGVELVKDVTPYEQCKLRILNGGHLAIGYPAALKRHRFFHEGMEDPELNEYLIRLHAEEILPVLKPNLPQDFLMNLDRYAKKIRSRFANPEIADPVSRIVMDGFSKMPTYVIPTIAENFKCGKIPVLTIRIIANWYLFMREVEAKKIDFEYIEPAWDFLLPFLRDGKEKKFATSLKLWGTLPVKFPEFSETLQDEIHSPRKKITAK